jgi:endonuclease/exonuclease/phosphatase family metal-dependent hydrolase
LDYILVSPAWQVVNYVEGGDIRSDHIPIQADLVLDQE